MPGVRQMPRTETLTFVSITAPQREPTAHVWLRALSHNLPGHDHASISAQGCRHQPRPALFQELSNRVLVVTTVVFDDASKQRSNYGGGRGGDERFRKPEG